MVDQKNTCNQIKFVFNKSWVFSSPFFHEYFNFHFSYILRDGDCFLFSPCNFEREIGTRLARIDQLLRNAAWHAVFLREEAYTSAWCIAEIQITVSGDKHFKSSCCPGINGKVYGCNKNKNRKQNKLIEESQ